jgi:PKD repeat protein
VDSGLAVQQYTYEVKATNGAGQGPAVTVQYTPVAVSVIADFSISTTLGNAPLSVYFVDLSTTNDPSGIVSWLWNFGDGVTSVEQNPTHVYSMAGIYTVSLTITTSLGQDVESKVDLISVLAIAPDAPHSFTAIVSGRSISLSWTVPPSNGGAPITAYKLYRGATSGSLQLLATAGNVFVYDDANLQPGTYYYAVSAVNEAELEGPLSSEASAVVANTPPVASFTMTGSDNDFDTQTLVTFNASSSHDAETPYANLQYRWTWMNPSTPGYVFFTSGWTNNPVISLVFPLWGVTYQGTLEVKDGQGAVATTNCNIWLWDADYISAGFSVTPGSGPVATEFAFDASASKYGYSMGGTFPVDQVRWTGRMTACGTSIGPPPRPQYTPFHHLGRTRLS